jgi:hypothetical protein
VASFLKSGEKKMSDRNRSLTQKQAIAQIGRALYEYAQPNYRRSLDSYFRQAIGLLAIAEEQDAAFVRIMHRAMTTVVDRRRNSRKRAAPRRNRCQPAANSVISRARRSIEARCPYLLPDYRER